MLASESKTKSGIVLRAISLGSLEILRQLANPLSTAEADLSAVDTRVPVEFLHMRGIYRLTGGSAVSYTAESSMAYRVLMGRKHPFLLLEGRTGERCAHEAPRRGTRKSVQEAAEEATAYDANNLNQYTAIQTGEEAAFVPTFDADGNQTKVKTSTGIWNVVYNAENRPVTFTSEDGATVVECTYDYMGRRHTRKITVNGSVTNYLRYIYRGYLQIAAINAVSGVFQWFILWDPTQPVATRPLGIRKDGTWYTYGWDLTKNICEVFGSDGYIKTAYTYTPYGAVTANGNVTQPIQWSSEYNDTELGLVYYNYRHYNPADGRWTGRDLIGEKSEYNLYECIVAWAYDALGLKIELVQPNYETTDLSLYTKSPRAKAYTAVLNREIVKEKLNPSFTYIKRENVVYAYIRKLQEPVVRVLMIRPNKETRIPNYTQSGVEAIIAHEMRRYQVYKNADRAYISHVVSDIMKYKSCGETEQKAREIFQKYIDKYWDIAIGMFVEYVRTENRNISEEMHRIKRNKQGEITGVERPYVVQDPPLIVPPRRPLQITPKELI